MSLKNIIHSEVHNILFEIKTKFDLSQFKSIKDIWDKIDYADQHLKIIDEGTSRVVFLLSNRFVLKVADPVTGGRKKGFEAGKEQNKSEVKIYKKTKDKSIITKIYNWADDYSWVIAELVRPITNQKEFEKLSSVDYENYYELLDLIDKFGLKSIKVKKFVNNLNNNFIYKVINLIKDYNLDPVDIMRWSQWGKTVNGKIVLLDYGLTNTVRKQFYEIKNKVISLKENTSAFSFNEFSNLNNLLSKFDYLSEHLKFLGKGSSRIVFLLTNNTVIKLANPQEIEKGTAQNKSEVEVYSNNQNSRNIITKIYDFDPAYEWIIAELVRPLKNEEEFYKITDIPWDMFLSVINERSLFDDIKEKQEVIDQLSEKIKIASNENSKNIIQTKINRLISQIRVLNKAADNPVIIGTLNLVNDADVMMSDIKEWDHWGLAKNNKLVLFDYGLTKSNVDLYKAV